MSTYSNEPQNDTWIIWFLISTISFLLMIIWDYNDQELPVIYDSLLFLTFVNFMFCIITGFKIK